MRHISAVCFCMFLLIGCGNDKPSPPEAQAGIIPIGDLQAVKAVEVAAEKEDISITVKHKIKGNDVFIECMVSNFSFVNEDKKKNAHGEGHIDLYLNGKKVDEIKTAAFVLKELPSGKHKIKIDLVHNDSTRYGVSEEFSVEIP